MAEQQRIRPVETAATPLVGDEAVRRLGHDYELMRAELARLRNDVRQLKESRDPAGVDDQADEELAEVERDILSFTGRTALWIRKHPLRLIIGLILLVVLLSESPRLWDYSQSYQSTDDAQIDGHIDPISARVAGTVTQVHVQDNQRVSAGTVLAEIDPRDYQIAVDKARADLAESDAEIDVTREQIDSVGAMIKASQATVVRTSKDFDRYNQLLKSNVVSDQTHDEAVEAAHVASSTTDSLRAEQAELEAAFASRQASEKAAKAALDQALLNLSYTRIVAPVAGIVGKLSVEIGEREQPGAELLAIVRNDDLWVTANFKETQLVHLRPGMKATVHVDALDTELRGTVESVAGASGEKYSILPAENAAGNFVKVVERIPVRINLAQGQQEAEFLRPGMSVEATVWLRQ